ncbi:CAP domain-containing protein [Fredinandcohnia sp. 179-A 10B2 NHS]|uniref:CAP domain-containing protein n=1 Tax=Fredinandcohnia sp. 179-A 10B2 NHS TaxID=3235176 RepID=UPI0039A1B0CC
MKKKFAAIVLTGALLVGGPIVGSAQSNADSTYKVYQKTYTVSFNENTNWNQYIQNLLSKYYSQFNKPTTTTNQEVEKETEQPAPQQKEQQVEQPVQNNTPVQQQPVAETKPVELQPTSYSLNQFEQKVVTLTNQERAKYGLAPLQIDEKLSEVARTKSADMKQNGYFSHTSPTYGSPFDMMKQFGIQYRAAGENIAMGQQSPEAVVQAWMNSEGHRKNILSSNFTHIGVGHVEGNYWTQMFIGK